MFQDSYCILHDDADPVGPPKAGVARKDLISRKEDVQINALRYVL